MIFSHSSRIRILHINFDTRLFLLGGFINNKKTSSGPILFTDIELHVESYSEQRLYVRSFLYASYVGRKTENSKSRAESLTTG